MPSNKCSHDAQNGQHRRRPPEHRGQQQGDGRADCAQPGQHGQGICPGKAWRFLGNEVAVRHPPRRSHAGRRRRLPDTRHRAARPRRAVQALGGRTVPVGAAPEIEGIEVTEGRRPGSASVATESRQRCAPAGGLVRLQPGHQVQPDGVVLVGALVRRAGVRPVHGPALPEPAGAAIAGCQRSNVPG